MDTRLMQQIKTILKAFPHYWQGEELQRNVVIEDLKSYDAMLISALLKNQKIKENYTVKAGETTIFKVQEFIDILRYKDYWADSYTKYANTIDLTSEGKYLQYNSDVVLDFPYKDCVLEGGMTKEDTGKEEVFYNNIIARDEIDTLLAPKAFVNTKKFDKDGEHDITEFSDEDNLIIKGNNLLALHSLKKRYAGKVQCIYIDPPYNTGNDSFKYNDRFNHSTWLTFMRNRLEIAKELLSDDGSIFVQIDDSQDSYLKVLMDSIFSKENFRNKITWKRRGGSANPSNRLNNVVEYILWYVKNPINMKYTPVYSLNDENTQKYIKERFTNIDENGRKYMKSPLQSPNYRKNLIYDYKGYKTPAKGYSIPKKVMEEWDDEGKLAFPDSKDKNINRKIYLDEYKGQPINALWTDIFVINPMSNERLEFSSGQKPEALIKRIFDMVSSENDIVLDFFMGSATTQAVAMKMNRRFIGIEQMDYINTVSVPRLQKVIEGEQGGISKEVNWQGGGSFVYAELMELNQGYMAKIDQSSSKEELASLWTELDSNADLNFQLDKEKLTNDLLKDHDEEAGSITFDDLTLAEQKAIFKGALDQNQLYVPYSELEDETIDISEQDKAFNRSFYNDKGVE
ncbi:site-specific DNA-methyltransferase [Lactococcus lactis]|uniref:site-specific DNA-methyltransferase n=1 Tax=Lactococcus lactis TaxID=1358 RepID=UPI00223A8268|nr:site-specific DNA-methyltransferase [Lactococcus lactis]MCT0026312.1 site-specific DNA-methyltransferase [Lactococcus lactis subsp. lactis]MCT3105930.1 site-specific DNA-methyltransferase [Lactococcus lactis]